MSDITEEDVMKYCYSRNLMLVTKESLEYRHRPIIIETMNKNVVPVEWIKKWAKKNGLDCYDYDYPTEKNDWWYAIEKMLEDWEKENNINQERG